MHTSTYKEVAKKLALPQTFRFNGRVSPHVWTSLFTPILIVNARVVILSILYRNGPKKLYSNPNSYGTLEICKLLSSLVRTCMIRGDCVVSTQRRDLSFFLTDKVLSWWEMQMYPKGGEERKVKESTIVSCEGDVPLDWCPNRAGLFEDVSSLFDSANLNIFY